LGAWGKGNWSNDNAHDWLNRLRVPADVETALAAVVEAEEPGNLWSCCALAAAEIVAACFGQSDGHLPDKAADWVARNRVPYTAIATSIKAAEKIAYSSELAALWRHSGHDAYADWVIVVEGLKSRLVAAL